MNMPKTPREVAGFTALPVTLKVDLLSGSGKHYVYIKQHEPQIPDEDAARSLFLVNIPISTNELHLRHLFATQLQAGRVEKVNFSANGITNSSALIATNKSSKKRKRQTVDELESILEQIYHLPATFPSELHVSGSTAIVTFVDRPSMESSLKAAKKATRSSSKEIVWGEGLGAKLPSLGIERYNANRSLTYPPRSKLLSIVNDFMTSYTALESARNAENAKKRQVADEDGFITVTRGSKGGVLRKEDAEEIQNARKEREGLEDFYRFQMREKRKEKQGEMLRRFEDDKKRVEEMRRRRGVLKPET